MVRFWGLENQRFRLFHVEQRQAPGVIPISMKLDDAPTHCPTPPTLDVVLHVFLIVDGDMQTVWFPVPVAAFFRRIVNVVSTLSISQQYLQSPADPDAPRSSLRRRRASTPQHDAYTDLDEAREKGNSRRKTSSSWTPDQIHLLMNNPALYDPLRKPRYPIVLCHGECVHADGIDDVLWKHDSGAILERF